MKKILYWIWIPLATFFGVFVGFFIRQPKVNKLKKQIEALQKNLTSIQSMLESYQNAFDDLFIRYKGLKVLQLKQKAEYENKLKDNLILQYGMKDYLTLLFDTVKNSRKLELDEITFYKTFDNVIEGKQIDKKMFSKIKTYVMDNHKREINSLKQCDCEVEFEMIEKYKKYK